MLRKCIVLAVILTLIFSLSACGLVPTKAPTEPATPGTTPTPTEELKGIKITVDKLIEEYLTNEIAADQKYKGRILIVVGEEAEVGRDPSVDKAYVSIGPYDSWRRVRCFFNNEDELIGIVKGQEVIVKGECLGKKKEEEGTSFAELLKNCSLIEETEFQLIGWEVREGLAIKFTNFRYSVTFHLINPQGIETSTNYESLYLTEGSVSLGLTESRYENPIPGGYKLLVKDTEENVIALTPLISPAQTQK